MLIIQNRKFYFPRLLLGIFAVAFIFIVSCSSDNPTEPEDPPGTPTLSVMPTSAPPATMIELNGITILEASLDSHYVLIGGEFSPLFVDSIGILYTTVPGFIDTIALWPAPPIDPVGIAVMHKLDTIAFGASILTVTPLLEAPGAFTNYIDDMLTVSSSISDITSLLFADTTEVSLLLYGYSKAIDSFLVSDDDSLLQATFAILQTDTTALKIVDALIASSGMADFMSSYADDMSAIATSLTAAKKLHESNHATSFSTTDISLAGAMQMSVLMGQYGNFIGSSLSSPSNVVGFLSIFSSFTSVLKSIPVIGQILNVASLAATLQGIMVQKFIVSAMPSRIKEFTLEFESDTILTGDETDATFHIIATNKPDPLTINDLVNVIMSGLGTWGSIAQNYASSGALATFLGQHLDDVQKALDSAVSWILNNIRSQMDQYLGNNPNVIYDAGILDIGTPIPIYTWEADIETPFLLELRTLHLNKIIPLTDQLNWEALYKEFGDATVYAVPSTAPEALAFTDPTLANFFGEYGAGAFGTDQSGTGNVKVVVQPELDVQMTIPSNIDPVNSEPVMITAGYIDATGQTVPTRDITLTLTAGGGFVSATNGTTNDSGQFTTQVQLTSGSQQVTVMVEAVGEVNSIDSVSETANVVGGIPNIWVETQEELNAFAGVTVASQVILRFDGSTLPYSINDLSPLSELREIVGGTVPGGGPSGLGLYITNTSLTSLAPLSKLTKINGNLRIQSNPNLGTMEGLNNLGEISGGIHIWDNPINSLAPLWKIQNCGQFVIGLLPNLTTLAGLTSLDSITMNFSISDGAPNVPRTALTSLSGFPNLSYLGGLIIQNSDIQTLNGFPPSITELGTDDGVNSGRFLRIVSSRKLTSIAALSNIVTINGDLEIRGVDSLASVIVMGSLNRVNGDLEVKFAPLIDSTQTEAWVTGITVTGKITIDP